MLIHFVFFRVYLGRIGLPGRRETRLSSFRTAECDTVTRWSTGMRAPNECDISRTSWNGRVNFMGLLMTVGCAAMLSCHMIAGCKEPKVKLPQVARFENPGVPYELQALVLLSDEGCTRHGRLGAWHRYRPVPSRERKMHILRRVFSAHTRM